MDIDFLLIVFDASRWRTAARHSSYHMAKLLLHLLACFEQPHGRWVLGHRPLSDAHLLGDNITQSAGPWLGQMRLESNSNNSLPACPSYTVVRHRSLPHTSYTRNTL